MRFVVALIAMGLAAAGTASAAVMLQTDPAQSVNCVENPSACVRRGAPAAAEQPSTPRLPEPAVAGLLGIVVLGLALLMRRRGLQDVTS